MASIPVPTSPGTVRRLETETPRLARGSSGASIGGLGHAAQTPSSARQSVAYLRLVLEFIEISTGQQTRPIPVAITQFLQAAVQGVEEFERLAEVAAGVGRIGQLEVQDVAVAVGGLDDERLGASQNEAVEVRLLGLRVRFRPVVGQFLHDVRDPPADDSGHRIGVDVRILLNDIVQDGGRKRNIVPDAPADQLLHHIDRVGDVGEREVLAHGTGMEQGGQGDGLVKFAHQNSFR